MNQAKTNVKIANVNVPVPVYMDKEITNDLVQQLNKLYNKMEADVGRIDTPVVALRMAYELAVRLREAQADAETSASNANEVVDTVATELDRLVRKHSTD